MPESFNTRLMRWGFNWFPAYRGTGARIAYIADDFREVRIELPLNWRTRNYVGTIFGGSMYAAVDPIYMVMLIKVLGPDYIVWDKAARIRFRKPGRARLHAHRMLPEEEIALIRQELTATATIERTYHVDLKDANDVIHASFEKVLHIRKRRRADGRKGPG